MITVIRAPLKLFCYWQQPVKGRLGRSCQNRRNIRLIKPRSRFVITSANDKNWFHTEKSRLITDHYNTTLNQISIDSRHFEIPCLRLAVSSL